MCRKIVINRGEKEIETPRQFLAHFGLLPENEGEIEMDLCLCGYDIEGTLTANKIQFLEIDDDLFVGELDLIVIPA